MQLSVIFCCHYSLVPQSALAVVAVAMKAVRLPIWLSPCWMCCMCTITLSWNRVKLI